MNQDWNNAGLAAGAMLMVMALVLTFVTVAGSYGPVLLAAIACMLAADGVLLVVYRNVRRARRALALLLMAPTLFIVADVLRRASSL